MGNLAAGLATLGWTILLWSGLAAIMTGRFYRRGAFGVEVMAEIVDIIEIYDEAGPAHALKVRFAVPGRGEVSAESRAYLNASQEFYGRHVPIRYSARNPTKVYIAGWDTPVSRLRHTLWAEAGSGAAGVGLLLAALVLMVAR